MAVGFDAAIAGRWLTEAAESGNPLSSLPAEGQPATLDDAAEICAEVLSGLGLVPCGLRLKGVIAGPMLEGRLAKAGAPVARSMLRHPSASAAVVGVLAAPLVETESGRPVFRALHPALDIAATRFTDATTDPLLVTADLGGLGLVVTGRGRQVTPGAATLRMGPVGSRRRSLAVDLESGFAAAAALARAMGGLPAGALLVLAGLSPDVDLDADLALDLAPLGKLTTTFA
jgi:hypothetical protein